MMTRAIPDLRITVESTIAERDEVAVRWTANGTHRGEGLGIPATGQPVEIHGLTWFRIRNGKFIEARDCWNPDRMVNDLRTACAVG